MTRLAAFLAFLLVPAVSHATEYKADTSHSQVGFEVTHLMMSKVRGYFDAFSVDLSYNPKEPKKTMLRAEIEVSSINTRHEKRDKDLAGEDFFDAANHPIAVFQSTKVEPTKAGLKMTGDLTMRGITKQVVLDVESITDVYSDPWGNQRRAAVATTTINREEWGMVWNKALETGGVLVSKEVTIRIEIEMIEKKPEEQ